MIFDERIGELAKALATNPTLLLADESLGGLDESEMDQAADILNRIRRELELLGRSNVHVRFLASGSEDEEDEEDEEEDELLLDKDDSPLKSRKTRKKKHKISK